MHAPCLTRRQLSLKRLEASMPLDLSEHDGKVLVIGRLHVIKQLKELGSARSFWKDRVALQDIAPNTKWSASTNHSFVAAAINRIKGGDHIHIILKGNPGMTNPSDAYSLMIGNLSDQCSDGTCCILAVELYQIITTIGLDKLIITTDHHHAYDGFHIFAIRMKRTGDAKHTNMASAISEAVHSAMPLDGGSAEKMLVDSRWKKVHHVKLENHAMVRLANKKGKLQVLV